MSEIWYVLKKDTEGRIKELTGENLVTRLFIEVPAANSNRRQSPLELEIAGSYYYL